MKFKLLIKYISFNMHLFSIILEQGGGGNILWYNILTPLLGVCYLYYGSVRPENGFQRMPNGCRTDRKYAKNTCPLISVRKSRLEGGEDHRGRFQERVNRTRTAFVTDKERLTNGQTDKERFTNGYYRMRNGCIPDRTNMNRTRNGQNGRLTVNERV